MKLKIIKESVDYEVVFKLPYLLSEDISPLICHRLDWETSGLLLVAKTKKAQQFYQSQFKKRQVKKQYLALVLGQFSKSEQIVEGFIARDKNKPFRFESLVNQKQQDDLDHQSFKIFNKKARWSKTLFQLIETKATKIFKEKKYQDFNYLSLVQARPQTGRRHQIRIHLTRLGYPILGDKTYNTKLSRKAAKNLVIPHLQLFAAGLEFKDYDNQIIKVNLKQKDLGIFK